MRILIILALLILLAGIIYFVNGVYWVYKLNARQDALGDNFPDTFRIELPLDRDMNGYFCITAKVNDVQEKSFILDTKATSMCRMEVLEELEAHYWDSYPVNVKNAYGQKEKLPIYELKSFTIGSLMIKNPLVKGISKTNALYDLLYKDILGKDIIKQFIWKFSLDEGKLVLFSKKDQAMLQIETQGYHKIQDGLSDNKVFLTFPVLSDSAGFSFDLGYQGEISIDKKLYNLLQDKYLCKKYLNARTIETVDTTYVFSGLDIEWNGIQVPDCQLCYYPLVNRNLIGANFLDPFNFILSYQKMEDTPQCADLFIQPRKDFDDFSNNTNCQNLGFDIGQLGGELLITLLEINGPAERCGLKIKDKVIEIDHGNIDLNARSVLTGQISDYLSDKECVALKVERAKKIIEYTIKL